MKAGLIPENDDDLRAEVRVLSDVKGGGATLARVAGVQPPEVSLIAAGQRRVTMKVARALGYKLMWVRVEE